MGSNMALSGFSALGAVGQAIPAWQLNAFVGLLGLVLLFGRSRLALVMVLGFSLYWGVMTSWEGLSNLPLYLSCGLAFVFLLVLAVSHSALSGSRMS